MINKQRISLPFVLSDIKKQLPIFTSFLGKVVLFSSLIAFSGCSLAPLYQQPAIPVPSEVDYSTPETSFEKNKKWDSTYATKMMTTGWREFFNDKRLQKIIEIALESNRDLRLALLKVQESRAQFGVARAGLFPQLDTSGSGTYSGTPSTPTTKNFGAQASASYELDLFGKLRSQTSSAFESYLGTEEARRASQILLVSQTATAYLDQRLAEEQLRLAQKTVTSRKSSFAFIQQRVQSGQSTLLELEQARSLVESANASVAETKRTLALAENALKLLVGKYTLPHDVLGLSLTNQSFTELPSYVPSSVLLKRPDIMQAEHALRAANADIGAARAAFFPSITLTGQAGYSGTDLNLLFAGANAAWSFIPKVTLPIFTGGKNISNLQLAKVRKEESIVNYEKAIQTAFKEVADALASRPLLSEQLAAQKRYLESQRTVLELAENRYAGGVISYLEVLDAQRGVFQAEQTLLALRKTQLTNDISLYIALGGGINETNRIKE